MPALTSAGDAGAQIEQLLLGSISSPQEASRLCAVQWANRLFPFSHVPARYICAMAAGDPKLEVREEGQAGLAPPKPQAASTTSKAPVVLLVLAYGCLTHCNLCTGGPKLNVREAGQPGHGPPQPQTAFATRMTRRLSSPPALCYQRCCSV